MMRKEMIDKINKQQKRIQELEFENLELKNSKKDCVCVEKTGIWERFVEFCKEND